MNKSQLLQEKKCECIDDLHGGRCQSVSTKLYKREDLDMWLCLDCILPGDIEL